MTRDQQKLCSLLKHQTAVEQSISKLDDKLHHLIDKISLKKQELQKLNIQIRIASRKVNNKYYETT